MALEDKLKELAEKNAVEKSVDWNEEKDKWMRAMGRLYTDIEGWMQPYVEKKLVSTRRTPIELSEDKIGRYKCQSLELDFSGHVICFVPVGTLLIHAWGKIDVHRMPRPLRYKPMLTLEKGREDLVWVLRPSGKAGETCPLSQQTLDRAIERWLDEK